MYVHGLYMSLKPQRPEVSRFIGTGVKFYCKQSGGSWEPNTGLCKRALWPALGSLSLNLKVMAQEVFVLACFVFPTLSGSIGPLVA